MMNTIAWRRYLALGLSFGLSLILAVGLSATGGAQEPPRVELQSVPLAVVPAWDASLVQEADLWGDRPSLITALDHSLSYLNTPAAVAAYADYPVATITHDRVRRSLRRFRTLLVTSQSPEAFYRALQREFVLYQSVGNDSQGTVHFTGYFEPVFAASRTPDQTYRYPLYRRPPNLDDWPLPHPTRQTLEGVDGLQASQGPLRGLELVWLRDRLDAFLVQVQGSARLQLAEGGFFSVGYAGRTDYPYTSIGRELINDGIIPAPDLTLERLLEHFEAFPGDLDTYLPRNQRFIFFEATDGGPPTGNLSVPVTAGRSIATDKSIMPPGALALITLPWPERDADGNWQARPQTQYVLDQDTGGAIQGAGRVDIFVGTGVAAGEQAGQINTDGALYYLLLRP
jgi:membrane-bound lytic murein transglycosylase A